MVCIKAQLAPRESSRLLVLGGVVIKRWERVKRRTCRPVNTLNRVHKFSRSHDFSSFPCSEVNSYDIVRFDAGEVEGDLLASKCISCPGTYVASVWLVPAKSWSSLSPIPNINPCDAARSHASISAIRAGEGCSLGAVREITTPDAYINSIALPVRTFYPRVNCYLIPNCLTPGRPLITCFD